ncbi:MAG: C4-dicarboxylate ABC transporter permease, partial [Desulfarculus sp.]|nr:C4-dicarboxylate ABC transporter permease [Desulfarculus sp.]
AICVFIVKAISGVSETVIYKGALPFILSLFLCAVLLFLFPGLATWLPGIFMS